jgi:hypothetical protein
MHHWIKYPNGHHVLAGTGFGIIRTGGRYYVITIGGENWAYWTDPATGRRFTGLLAACKAKTEELWFAQDEPSELNDLNATRHGLSVEEVAPNVAAAPPGEVARLLGRLTKGAARHLRKTLHRLGRPDLAALPRDP